MSSDPAESQGMEQVIRDYINKEMAAGRELPPIRDDTEMVESGVLDSLSILRLVLFIEERYSVKISPGEVVRENFETVNALCRFLRGKKNL